MKSALRRCQQVVTIGGLAVLLAGCTGSPGNPAPTVVSTSGGTPQPSIATASPSGTGTTSAGATLPPGTTVLARSFAFGAVAWSPDGSAVAAEALGQTMGTGSVDLFSPAGIQLASLPGFDFGWLDATHLLVYRTTPNDAASGTVSDWTITGQLVETLPGTYGGVLANGQGAALLRPAPPPHA